MRGVLTPPERGLELVLVGLVPIGGLLAIIYALEGLWELTISSILIAMLSITGLRLLFILSASRMANVRLKTLLELQTREAVRIRLEEVEE